MNEPLAFRTDNSRLSFSPMKSPHDQTKTRGLIRVFLLIIAGFFTVLAIAQTETPTKPPEETRETFATPVDRINSLLALRFGFGFGAETIGAQKGV